ncbi:MAG: hypothetical protein C5B57_09495 [Blastocatellia bacterium]|nr:MAG: hypothetical protein C5B57_09495 [Blastocatellia bacterium]
MVPEAATPYWTTTLDTTEVLSVIEQARASKVPESVRVGQLQMSCIGLQAGEERGALVLARAVSDATASEARSELEVAAAWFRPAVEAHLRSSSAESIEHAPRVSALLRVLTAAVTTGTEPALLRLYANALAIWHDVELRAYAEDAEGNFRLEVAPPGAPRSDAPAILTGSKVSVGSQLTRLSGHDLETLGFHNANDAWAARIGHPSEGMVWLLLMSGGLDSAGGRRLELYTDVLRQTLQQVAARSLLGVERAIWRRLIAAGDRFDAAAEAALSEARAVVEATGGALSISLGHDRRFLQIGDLGLLPDSGPSRWDQLTTSILLDDGPAGVLTVQGPGGRFFTSRDRAVIDIVGQLLGSWASGVSQRSQAGADRRGVSRSFEDVLEETAAQAADRGMLVSVVVIQLKGPTSPAGTLHQLAAQLRVHLRAGESVGVLGPSEIGILLYDATAEVARLVVGRLRRMVAHSMTGDPLANAAIGVVQSAMGPVPTLRLVPGAREEAQTAWRSMALEATSHEATR